MFSRGMVMRLDEVITPVLVCVTVPVTFPRRTSSKLLSFLHELYVVCVLTMFLQFIDSLFATVCRMCDQGRRCESGPLGKLLRATRIVLFFVKTVVVVDVLVGRDPIILLAKLKTSTTILVLMFGSDVVKFISNVRLSTGGVLGINS